MSTPALLPVRRWSAEAHAGLAELLARPAGRTRRTALDWDQTAFGGDISYALLDDLEARSGGGFWDRFRALERGDPLEAYTALARWILAGRAPAAVRRWTREVCARALDRGTLAWIPEIADLVAHLHPGGWEVWVVTGSPTEVVAALSPTYGIPAHRVIGMDAPLGPDGRYLDRLEAPVPWREGKARRFEERAGGPPDLALGDSEGDIALLRSAAHAVWIDRGDAPLAAAARAHGWWRQGAWT